MLLGQKQMGVPPADHQREHRKLQRSGSFLALQQHSMNVTLDVVDRNQRLFQSPRQRLGKAHPGQQRARQPGAVGHGNGVHVGIAQPRLGQRGTGHRNQIAQMLPAGQLRHHAAIGRVGGNLRSHHARHQFFPAAHQGRSRFVAGALNAQNQCAFAHP
jgi:hypothetical protein